MHCKQCDAELTDFESTRKIRGTSEYLDLCTPCFRGIQKFVKVAERMDLLRKRDVDDEDSPDDSDKE